MGSGAHKIPIMGIPPGRHQHQTTSLTDIPISFASSFAAAVSTVQFSYLKLSSAW